MSARSLIACGRFSTRFLDTGAPSLLEALGDIGAKLRPIPFGQVGGRSALRALEEEVLQSSLGLALLVAANEVAQVLARVAVAAVLDLGLDPLAQRLGQGNIETGHAVHLPSDNIG